MIWVVAFIIVMIISSVLAYRSMKDLGGVSSPEIGYGLFLIRNMQALNLETLTKIHAWSKQLQSVVAFEKLFKGSQSVSVVYAPLTILDFLPELSLLQLENYLPEVSDSYIWEIAPKTNPKKIMVSQEFLKTINLKDEQQFFWQIVCEPFKKDEFQITIRAMVVDKEQVRKIELAKVIDKHILDSTGLIRLREDKNTILYQAFVNRTLVKKQVRSFLLSTSEVLSLLG